MNGSARIFLQDAFLLHRRPYRETSLLIDVLTRDHGLVGMIAKGVMRGRGAHAALLRPFVPLAVSWAGRSGLPILTEVEGRGSAPALSGKSLYCGFYLNELLMRLLPAHDPHPDLFVRYEHALSAMRDNGALELTLRLFELALLDQLGYGPEFAHEGESGRVIQADRYYRYDVEKGVYPAQPGPGSLRGATLLGLCAGRLSGDQSLDEAKRLMRAILHHHLGGRPLKSRDLFKFTRST